MHGRASTSESLCSFSPLRTRKRLGHCISPKTAHSIGSQRNRRCNTTYTAYVQGQARALPCSPDPTLKDTQELATLPLPLRPRPHFLSFVMRAQSQQDPFSKLKHRSSGLSADPLGPASGEGCQTTNQAGRSCLGPKGGGNGVRREDGNLELKGIHFGSTKCR